MRKVLLIAVAVSALSLGAANAKTVSDPVNDFLATYTGAHTADLDVTSFSVDYDAATTNFTLSATMAGPINAASGNLYVIGADTGTGTIHPFAALGEPNVLFNQAIVVAATGVTTIGGHPNLAATISGDMFSVVVPLADLPSTGWTPADYGFNLWPKNSANSISDFSPQNALLAAAPEPGVWAMMMVGLAMVGFAMRRSKGGLKAVTA